MNSTRKYCFILLSLLVIIIFSCGREENTYHPIVVFISPDSGSEFIAGQIVSIEISAYDADGEIADIVLSIDGNEKAILTTEPYIYSWNTKTEITGVHNLSVICTDNMGNSATATILVKLNKGKSVIQ